MADHIKIQLICEEGADQGTLSQLAEKWNLIHCHDAIMALVLTPENLQLRKMDEPKLGVFLSILFQGQWRTDVNLVAAVVKPLPKLLGSKRLFTRCN